MGDEVIVRDGRTRSVWRVRISSTRPGSWECGIAACIRAEGALRIQQRMEYDHGYCARVVEDRESIDG